MATADAADGKLDSLDPFLVLYPPKKKSALGELMRHGAAPPPSDVTAADRAAVERIARGDAPLPLGEYAPPPLLREPPDLRRQGDVAKGRLRWRGGFLKDADATLHT